MLLSMEQIGIEEARRRLGDIVDRARLTHEHTQITRMGKPAAVVVSAEWYEQAKALIAAAGDLRATNRAIRDQLNAATGPDVTSE
jgi:prevent-host-death family protein